MYKILILGTSNSLLRNGWVDGLKSALPNAQIDNKSIGASPGIQFASEINNDFTHYDFVFFDSIPNDEEYQYHKRFSGDINYSSEKFVNDIIYQICHKISTETTLIIMGFCRKECIHSISSVYMNRLLIARSLSAQFIDIRSIIISYMRIYALGIDDVYEEHPSHPNRNISNIIGRILSTLLKNIKNNKIKRNYNNFADNFFVWQPIENQGYNVQSFSNSLLTELFAIIKNNSNIKFAQNGVCIGFHINACATNASVSLTYKGSRIYNISLYYNDRPNKLLKIFIPIPYGVQLDCIEAGDFYDIKMKGLLSNSEIDIFKPIQLAISNVVFYHKTESIGWQSNLAPEQDCLIISKEIELLALKISPIFDQNDSLLLENIKKIPSLDFLKKNRFYIKTHHNTFICANLITKSIICSDLGSIKEKKFLMPVSLELNCARVFFYIKLPGLITSISIEKNSGKLKLNINDHVKIIDGYEITYLSKMFSIKDHDSYLSAQPNGRIICNRQKVSCWEKFSLSYIGDNWEIL